MAKRKLSEVVDEEEEEEAESFTVEYIREARVMNPDRIEQVSADLDEITTKWEYLIKWLNYDNPSDDTWEPHDSMVSNCRRLIESFWMDVGWDNEDYLPGHAIKPTEKWIKLEKKRIRKELKETQDKQHKKPLTREQEDALLPNSAFSRKGKGKAPTKKRKTELSSRTNVLLATKRSPSESDSDSDVPLATSRRKRNIVKTSSGSSAKDSKRETLAIARDLFEDDDDSVVRVPRASTSAVKLPKSAKPPLKVDTSSVSANAGAKQPASGNPSASHSPAIGGSASAQGTPALPGHSTPTIPQTRTPIIPDKAPTKDKSVPAHRQGGRMKMMPEEDLQISGNVTKHKIFSRTSGAAGALPSFKKKPAPTGAANTAGGPASAGPASGTPTMPFAPWASAGKSPVVQSPSFGMPPPSQIQPQTSRPNVSTPTLDADTFLASMNLDMSGDTSGYDNFQPPVPEPMATSAVPSFPRFAKLFKWEGSVYLSQPGGKDDQHLGQVALSELPVALTVSDGMRLDMALPKTTLDIRFSAVYRAADLVGLLPTMKQGYRFATMTAKDPTVLALSTFADYTGKHSLAVVRPTEPNADGNVEGLLVFFHPKSPLTAMFSISKAKIPADACMIIALVSRVAATPIPPPAKRLRPSPTRKFFTDEKAQIGSLQRAIRILKFPDWLHAYLKKKKRDYCIWWSNTAHTTKTSSRDKSAAPKPGFETRNLTEMLGQYEGKNVGFKTDVSVVFVHISAVKTLHKLPAYVERIWKRVDVLFVVYGSHFNAPISTWGTKRIYRSGGMVTFSPAGFAEDPLAAFERCISISEQKLWSVRVIPSILGLLVRMYYKGQDALDAFDRKKFKFQFLLSAIEEGKMTFSRVPVSGPSWSRSRTDDWIHEQIVVLAGGPREILEYALREFDAKYPNATESSYTSIAHDILAEEMRLAQLNPTIMQQYRRFVILASEEETKKYTGDSFEWRTASAFEFSYKSKSQPQPN